MSASANFGIAHVDLQGRIIRIDDGYAGLFGVSPQEAVGRLISEFTYVDEGSSPEMLINIVVRTGQPLLIKRTFRHVSGARVECDVQLCLLRDGGGFPSGIIGVAQRTPL